MPTRFRKVRKRRGSRTMGWGQIGQHRKTGAKGGRGMAGGHKHNWTKLLKEDYFGKQGFHNPTSREERAININGLQTLVEKMEEKEGVVTINLDELGYDRLVGKGVIHRPVVVAVAKWSKQAEEKIKAVGGRIIRPEELATQKAA